MAKLTDLIGSPLVIKDIVFNRIGVVRYAAMLVIEQRIALCSIDTVKLVYQYFEYTINRDMHKFYSMLFAPSSSDYVLLLKSLLSFPLVQIPLFALRYSRPSACRRQEI